MFTTRAFAAGNPTLPLAAASIPRRDVGPNDVELDILFCGVCHSDLHTARNQWAVWPTVYPCVPGHEIVGRVTKTGSHVTASTGRPRRRRLHGRLLPQVRQLQRGSRQSCDTAAPCSPTTPRSARDGAGVTYGGYSKSIVVKEHFVLRVSPKLAPAAVAPLLCAGITLYSPLKHWNAGPGKKVGIVGLGGLGHMGVKFAHAFGAKTVLLTTSPAKIATASGSVRTRYVAEQERRRHEAASAPVRPDRQRRRRVARPRPVRVAAAPRRHAGAGRRARTCASVAGRLQPAVRAPLDRGQRHRRHRRDAADARLLRREEHHLGHRADSRAPDSARPGLRAHAQKATSRIAPEPSST